MTHAADVPLVVAVLVSVLVVGGAILTLIGALGLLRLRSFYDRLHAPTLGTTLGTGCVLIASIVLFSALQSRPVLHEIAIGLFMTITTPVTFMILLRASVLRDPPNATPRDDPSPDTERRAPDGQAGASRTAQ